MTGRIHQVLVGAAPGDAITAMARRLRTAFRATGESEIYARFLHADVHGDVLPLHDLPRPRAGDRLVYHSSYGDADVTRTLLSRPEPLVLVYHNITPASFYADHDPTFASGLDLGRQELAAIRSRVRRAVAVSSFNARELTALGYGDVRIIPVGLDPAHLTRIAPNAALRTDLAARYPDGYVLGLSQLMPHKRFETVLQAMHLVQWVHELRCGLVIVGAPRQPRYQQALHRHAVQLNVRGLWFAGALPDDELAAAFAGASAFVSASAHEGLALPPLEAMAFGVPTIARAAGAIADTIGTGGIVLPAGSGPVLLAEAIAEVLRNDELRAQLVRCGHARVAEVAAQDPSAEFVELLTEVA